MDNNLRDLDILGRIVEYCNDIDEIIEMFGGNIETFVSNKAYRHSIAMCILQIGELVTNLTEDFREQNPVIPWREIRAMRNVFAHRYGRIDIKTTWATIHEEVPILRDFCTDAIERRKFGESWG
ncbi:MAG: DUF86 domain-containing protein [Clostridiales bacterium]|nr:DUF86 domain-containing protein [Clostridiales bacterium]